MTEKLGSNRKEKLGWLILAERSMKKMWNNKKDNKVWNKYWSNKMTEIDYSKPFRVRVIQDCRGKSEKLDGQYGLCLGMYKRPNIWEKERIEGMGNPLILTDSGEYIWGIECWWDPNPDEHDIPLGLQKIVLELHKQNLRKQFGIDYDPSVN